MREPISNSKEKTKIQANQSASSLTSRIRKQLKNFSLRAKNGELVGLVRDIIPASSSDKPFSLIITQPGVHPDLWLFLLNSKYLRGVDTAKRSIYSNLDVSEINQLPKYKFSPDLNKQFLDSLLVSHSPTVSNMSDSVELFPIPPNNMQTESPGTQHSSEQLSQDPLSQNTLSQNTEEAVLTSSPPEVNFEKTVQLLEERLIVDRTKRKVGEVIVRKEIETRIVEVPIRREKLIVEQVGSENKQLAEIDLGSGELTGVELAALQNVSEQPALKTQFSSLEKAVQTLSTVSRAIQHDCKRVKVHLVLEEMQATYHEFSSLKAAVDVLGAIAKTFEASCREVKVELQLENKALQEIYQQWFDRHV